MGFLSTFFSATAGSVIEAVGNAIDKNVTTDEERKELENEISKAAMQYDIEMAGINLEERKAVLSDLDSARVNQSRVQEAEHASWLAKNVHPLLAVSIVGLTFAIFFWILSGQMDDLEKTGMKDITIYILGALTTISTQVVAYFFGSSQGSKDKQKSLSDIAVNAPARK